MTKSILVTGAAGFIGSHFAKRLFQDEENRIIIVDKLTYAGSADNIRSLLNSSRVSFIQGDIGDRALISGLLSTEKPMWIVNFAAETHVDRSIESAFPFYETNVMKTLALLEETLSFFKSLPPKQKSDFRYVQISTDEVFGSAPEGIRFIETAPFEPNSPYAASKAAQDHLVRAFSKTHDLPAMTTHTTNNYGPNQFPEKLIPLMILNALQGKELPIYGDGGNVRDWIYVDDNAEGIMAVLNHGVPGEVYNISAQNEISNRVVIDQILDVLSNLLPPDKNDNLRAKNIEDYQSLKKFVPDRPGHDRRYALDSTKLRTKTKWAPRVSLSEGLTKTVRWYMDNPEWVQTQESKGYKRERLGLI